MGETLSKPQGSATSPDDFPGKNNPEDEWLTGDEFDTTIDTVPVENEADATKNEIASLPDAETRFKDIALLNGRERFKSTAHDLSVNQVKRVGNYIAAKFRNLKDTPGLHKRAITFAIAESRFNRHQAKMERLESVAPQYKLRHTRKFEKVERKYTAAKSEYDERNGRMEARTTSVGENVEKRRAEYVSKLISNKETALARKAARHELRSQGARRGEAKEIANSIPAERLRRAGRLAVSAEAAKRQSRQETRQVRNAERSGKKIDAKLQENQRRIEQYTQEAADADASYQEISTTTLPEATEHFESLEDKLRSVGADDPSRPGLEAQVSEAALQVKKLEQELPRLTYIAARSREQVASLAAEQAELSEQQRQSNERTEKLSEQQTATNETHGQLASESHQAIHEMLTTDAAAEIEDVNDDSTPTEQPATAEANSEQATTDASPEQSESQETIATEAEHYLALRALREAQREMAKVRQARNAAFDAYNDANAELNSPDAALLPEQQKNDYGHHRDVLKGEYDDAQAAYEQKELVVRERTDALDKIEAILEKSHRNVAV